MSSAIKGISPWAVADKLGGMAMGSSDGILGGITGSGMQQPGMQQTPSTSGLPDFSSMLQGIMKKNETPWGNAGPTGMMAGSNMNGMFNPAGSQGALSGGFAGANGAAGGAKK